MATGIDESVEVRHFKGTNDTNDKNVIVYRPLSASFRNSGKWPEKNSAGEKDSSFLYLSAFTVNLIAFVSGVGYSWTSPVVPKLRGPDNPLNAPVDDLQVSLITALLSIGGAAGPFAFGYLCDRIGRKKTLILVAACMTVALTILAFARDVRFYYVARFIHGVGIAGCFTALIIYTAEITQDHNRGKFSCIQGVFVALGFFYSYSAGPYLNVRTFCLSCLLPLQIFLIFFPLFMPESPFYLVKIGDESSARKAIRKLHRKSAQEATQDVSKIRSFIDSAGDRKGGFRELFATKASGKAFAISQGLMIIQQLSGVNVVYSFLHTIFRSTQSTISAEYSSTLVSAIQVVAVLLTPTAVEKLGRKFLLLSSSIGSAVSVISLGVYFLLQRNECDVVADLWWLPISSLFLFNVSFNIGLGRVSWTVVSEIFPTNVKSFATALASTTCSLVSFVVIFSYPVLSPRLGVPESFFVFGGCSLIGAVFIYAVIPETKGKSLPAIQELLSR
ncbi:facilitated trehalose transporter Tret1-like [Cylas formicarius]|uniref:facilitated trehalose transporter Tret1-like n=1 Tax=Cylas formicarius TaxID=197179 RepID=UPI0029586462|nr:facilitated trehalose transporter Tret1-like [Cylas formicarius]